MKPESGAPEVDALTTRPSELFSVGNAATATMIKSAMIPISLSFSLELTSCETKTMHTSKVKPNFYAPIPVKIQNHPRSSHVSSLSHLTSAAYVDLLVVELSDSQIGHMYSSTQFYLNNHVARNFHMQLVTSLSYVILRSKIALHYVYRDLLGCY